MSAKMTAGCLYHMIAHMNMVNVYTSSCRNGEGGDEVMTILNTPMSFDDRLTALEELKRRLNKENPSEEGRA